MDKYEYKLRAEEIRELVKEKRYEEALPIVEKIDWNRVRGASMLTIASEVYKMNHLFEEAREILLLAYDRHPGKRSIIFSLCELCLKMGDFISAVKYYKEFVKVATRDSRRYILQYKIFESQDVSVEERIEVLEEYKKHDYRERWAYELAYLYHRAGLGAKCVEECDELIVWFGEGKYVKKAMELKMRHKPLSAAQKEKYQRMTTPKQEAPSKTTDEIDIHVKTMDMSKYNTINLQEELAESMQELIRVAAEVEEENRRTSNMQEAVEEIAKMQTPKVETETFFGETKQNLDVENQVNIELEEEHIPRTEEMPLTMEQQMQKSVFVVEGLDEVQKERAREEARELEQEIEREAVREVDQEAVQEVEEVKDVEEEKEEKEEKEEVKTVQEIEREVDKPAVEYDVEVRDDQEYITIRPIENGSLKDLKIDQMLHQGYDGQLSLLVPEDDVEEEESLEFTGQLSINDVLLEWECKRKEIDEKRKEEVRKNVLDQTSDMFSEFDAATKAEIRADLKRLAAGINAPDYKPVKEDEEEVVIPDLNNYQVEPLEKQEVVLEDVETNASIIEEEHVGEVEMFPQENSEVLTQTGMIEISSEAVEESVEESIEEPVEESVEEPVEEVEMDAQEIAVENEAEGQIESSEEEELVEALEASDAFEETEDDMYDEEDAEEDLPEEDPIETPGAFVRKELEESKAFLSERDSKNFHKEVEKELKKQESKKKEKNIPLTKEQQKLFGPFVQNKESKIQVLRMIEEISLASYTGNVILTGEIEKRTLELAKCVIKQLQYTEDGFTGKVAKISAGILREKGFAKTFDRLTNGAIIVENAGMFKKVDIVALRQALQREEHGILVILTDTDRAINRLITRNERILNEFNARIDITELDNDSLVTYGEDYALGKEYSIDEMGRLALYTRISDTQTCVHAVDTKEVEEIVDEAIESALRKTPKHFFHVLFNARYDEEDRIILKEDNFLSY